MSTPKALRPDMASSLLERLCDVGAADPLAADLGRMLLAPLEREDRERGNNLVQTLLAYYESGTRVDRTAECLFLHRNSVRYRLDRIRSLLGLDIDEPKAIAALTIALGCLKRMKMKEDASAS